MALASKVTWRDGMAFDAEVEGFTLALDADASVGGRGLGPKPKALLLTSLVGCTAMDVIAILAKMKVPVERFEVAAEGETVEEHPKRFRAIVVRYRFEGQDLPVAKLRRAVQLSEEKYCGVSATLRPQVEMRAEIWLNGALVPAEDAG